MIRSIVLTAACTAALLAAESSEDEALLDPFADEPAEESTAGQTEQAMGSLNPFADRDAPGRKRSQQKPWELGARISFGYDDNVTLESDAIDLPSDQSSAFIALAGSIKHRRILDNGWRLNGQAFAEHHFYTDLDDNDISQAGLVGSLVGGSGSILHSAVLGYNFIALDGDSAAHALNGSYRMSWIVGDEYVWFGAGDLIWIDYPDVDEASGVRMDLRGGVWYIFDPQITRRRLEAEIRASSYRANEDYESYNGLRSNLRYRWRWQPGETPVDLAVGLQNEYRDYDDGIGSGSAEWRLIHRAVAECDWWLHPNYAIGLYLRGSLSDSNHEANDYERAIIGTSLVGKW